MSTFNGLDLEKKRRLRGIPYSTLAAYCGCSRQFIHQLLRGQRQSQHKMKKLNEFFQIKETADNG